MSVRERLAQAAFELFAERGFDETTVDDITARAGTGRTTFFRVFGSKEEVVFPDHERLLAAVRARLAAATPGSEPLAISEAARLVLRHYLDEGDLARTRYQLTSRVPALRAREIAGQRQYQRLFLDFTRRWYGEGPRAALRAELLADAVVTAHNHVLRQWLRGRSETPEADFDAAMADVLALFAAAPGSPASPTGLLVLRTGRDLDDVLPDLRRLLE